MAPNVWETVTLRYWHGGRFNVDRHGVMVYVGGQGKTYQCLADELCYFELIEFAKKSGNYSEIHGVYYQVPGLSLQEGLRKVENDTDVFAMGEIAMKYRTVDVFVSHQEHGPILLPAPAPQTQTHFQSLDTVVDQPSRPKKITPKKGPPKKPIHSIQNSPHRSSPRLRDVVILGTSSPNLVSPKSTTKTDKSKPLTCFPTNPTADHQPFVSSPQNKQTSTSHIPPINPTATHQPSSSSAPHQVPDIQPTQQSNTDDYDWLDSRPESPLKYNQLVSDSGSDSDDPLCSPVVDDELGGEAEFEDDVDLDGEAEFDDEEVFDDEAQFEEDNVLNEEAEEIRKELEVDESDTSDEEYHLARSRVRKCTSKLLDIAQQLQKEAEEGRLAGQQPKLKQPSTVEQREGESGHESEYYDSDDDLETPPGSEDEGQVGRRCKRALLVGADTDFSNFEWRVGQRFATREDFKQAVAKFAIMQGINLGVVISDKERRQEMGVKCEQGCLFYLYSSWHSKKGSYIVKRVVNEHQCQRNMKRNKQMTTRWVAKEMLEVFKARPHWPAKEIRETIKRAYRALVSNDFAYKVKYKAHLMLHGSMQDHYNKVGSYMAALKAVSPSSVVELVVDGSKKTNPPIFQRFFNCFDGLRKGWKEGCRPIICVDASFLKTFLGGQILSAVGRDSNEQMYPICWAVVEGENLQSWEWFFNHLKTCLQLGDGSGYAIVSDEHLAILSAVANVLPGAEHRHCARHVYSHWRKHFKGDEMKLAFWKVVKAYSMVDYTEALEELNNANAAAAASFRAYTPRNFCRAFMNPAIKCDAVTNNMAETFNGYIINARTKHLLYMLEDIRGALMQRVCSKRQEMEKKPGVLCHRIQAQLNKEKSFAPLCEVIPSTDNIFNVNYNLDTLVVDLVSRSCTCMKWDMVGVPCCHAIACIYFLNMEAEEFVDEYYTTATYLRTYANPIPACVGERHWPRVENKLDPPPIKVGPGRPRKNRIRDPFEDPKRPGTLTRHGMEMTCSLCSKKGHNKRGCPEKGKAVPQEPPPKKAKGRPRKYPQTPQSEMQSTASTHLNVSAQPTQLGRGGRMVLGGVGARGGSCGRGAGRASTVGGRGGAGRGGGVGRGNGGGRVSNTVGGRGGAGSREVGVGRGNGGGAAGRAANGRGRGRGRNQVPIGVGVIMTNDGTPITNVFNGRGRARPVNAITNQPTQGSQRSIVINNTPQT